MPFFKRFLNSRLALPLAVLLLIFFLSGFFRAFAKDRSIQKEIQALERERDRLEQSKLHLLGGLQEIKSEAFLEKEAREKFALQKPGEKALIVIDDRQTVRSVESSSHLIAGELGSNTARWWNYFFAPSSMSHAEE